MENKAPRIGTVKWFDTLTKRDFENQAILNDIRKALREREQAHPKEFHEVQRPQTWRAVIEMKAKAGLTKREAEGAFKKLTHNRSFELFLPEDRLSLISVDEVKPASGEEDIGYPTEAAQPKLVTSDE